MSEFITEAFTLLGVAIVIIGLRTVARWIMVGPKNFQADDYIMLVACVSIQHERKLDLANDSCALRLCTGWKLLLHIWSARGLKV